MSLWDLGTQQVGAMDLASAHRAQCNILRSRSTATKPGQGSSAPIDLQVEKRVNFPGRQVRARLTINSHVFASISQLAAFNVELIGKLHSWAYSSGGRNRDYTTHTQPLLHSATRVCLGRDHPNRPGCISAILVDDPRPNHVAWEFSAPLPTHFLDKGARLPLPSTFEGLESSAVNFSLIDGVLKAYVSYYWRVTSINTIHAVLKVPFIVCSIGDYPEPIRSMVHPAIPHLNTIPHIPTDWKAYTSGVRTVSKRLVTKGTIEVVLLMPPPVHVTPATQLPFFLHFKMHAKKDTDFGASGDLRMPLIPGQPRPPKEVEYSGPVRFTMRRRMFLKTDGLFGSHTNSTDEETHIPVRWMATRGNEAIPGFGWTEPKRVDAPKFFWKSEALIGGFLLPQVVPALRSNYLSFSYALHLHVPIAGAGNGWDRSVCGWDAVGPRNSDVEALGLHATDMVLGAHAASTLPGFEPLRAPDFVPAIDGPPGPPGFVMVNDAAPEAAGGLPAYHRVPQDGERTAIAPARRPNGTSNNASTSNSAPPPPSVASDSHNKQV